MLITDKNIAIIGGDPGGLTLARLLLLKGARVNVYERDFDRNVRVQGATLDLHEESGLAALRAANLMEEFKNNFRPGADKMVIVNEQAKIFYSEHENTKEESGFGNLYFRPEIDRGPLRDLLLHSLQPDTIVWDSNFFSMVKQDEGWKLHFKNGSIAYADIVIAADGANSKVRPYLTDIKPFYSGVTALEGNVYNAETAVPNVHKLLQGGKIFAFGNSHVLIVSSKGSGDLTFYTSAKTEENWTRDNNIDYSDTTQVLEWFKETFSAWGNVWNELFEHAITPFIPRPVCCMPLNQTWNALPNLTMLGDAAHLMPPFAGEGVNMAMLDALELSECLASEKIKSLQEAISGYEKQMLKRAAQAAQKSLDNTEWMHKEKALDVMLDFFAVH